MEFELEERKLLDKIDFDKGTIEILGKRYKLNDTNFPTVNPKMPYKLTEEEEILVSKLKFSFMNNDKLHNQGKL